MNILIVEEHRDLGALWQRHLAKEGRRVTLCRDQACAIAHLQTTEFHVIVMNAILAGETAFAISDFANYRWPAARVVFVTASSFFTDGSVFQHASNACACLPASIPPTDLAIMVSHYGGAAVAS